MHINYIHVLRCQRSLYTVFQRPHPLLSDMVDFCSELLGVNGWMVRV